LVSGLGKTRILRSPRIRPPYNSIQEIDEVEA